MSEAFWRGAVNRRAKNLAMMKPFFDLEDNKGRVDLRPYDMHLLCSVLMEAIITEMNGLATGAQYSVLTRETGKIILRVNPSASTSDIDRITSHLLDHLTSGRGRDHFEVSYQSIGDDGAIQTLTHAYRLLEQGLSPEGELVYLATPEAIHIYLGGLGHELEVEQAANDAILDHYLKRGKHREAGEAADMARKRSVELRSRIRSWQVAAERSFDEIEYAKTVLPELARIRTHVEERGRVEQRQIEEIQNRALQLQPGEEGRNTLVEARKAIEEAALEHVRLLADLQRCSRMLLEWQVHHRFSGGGSPAVPDPMTGFLEPLMKLKWADFDRFRPVLWALAMPPRIPVLPDLPALMDSLLAEVRAVDERSELEPLAESFAEIEPPRRFTPEVVESVQMLVRELGGSFSLSEALAAGERKFGRSSAELSYLSVLVPQWFENEADDGRIARRAAAEFETAGMFGDELRITLGDSP